MGVDVDELEDLVGGFEETLQAQLVKEGEGRVQDQQEADQRLKAAVADQAK